MLVRNVYVCLCTMHDARVNCFYMHTWLLGCVWAYMHLFKWRGKWVRNLFPWPLHKQMLTQISGDCYKPEDYEMLQDFYGLHYTGVHYHHSFCRAQYAFICRQFDSVACYKHVLNSSRLFYISKLTEWTKKKRLNRTINNRSFGQVWRYMCSLCSSLCNIFNIL